ncbi:aldose 1-epimerase [Pseudorhodobacter antarcticus]|uniref:Aldose 1-epimerase n=1 Tax=Pseudorhodobacter antarcticus TaxID=1077947 RepID=A0A1H8EBD0_9RHOB|nr:aldose epimerase family protein [Pseudorhodobacter antarcticus]SEN16690.1 aldose 1-epimerase [Pseudorhodobacter antarcticus]
MTQITPFGHAPHGPVHQITLQNDHLTAHILTLGATLRDLRLHGHAPPLVLGFEILDPYLTQPGYFGATVGRCANRIAQGRFMLDGQPHQLDINNAPNHLHGGANGISTQIWTIADHTENTLTLTLTDAPNPYPGTLNITQTFRLTNATLDITITATTDQPTLCNIAHHSYFNLGAPDIRDHTLTINAPHHLPTQNQIPTGTLTMPRDFDFQTPRRLRDANPAIDHNFCLTPGHAPNATLRYNGLQMDLHTDQPGLQIYDAARMHTTAPGLAGHPYGPYAGLAMEPQFWPDAINHPDWAQPILRPGQTYRQSTQFTFIKGTP